MFRFGAIALASAEAAELAVTWADCGAKHGVVSDLQPTTIHTGATETITGSGTSDEDVTSAQFTATLSALGTQLTQCGGDATTDIVCELPMGVGSITVKAVTFPMPKGPTSIPVEVSTSTLIPPSLASVDVHIEAVDQNGESAICMDVHTTPKQKSLEASNTAADFKAYKTARKQYTVKGMDKTSNKVDVWYPKGTSEKFPFISYSHGNTAGGTKLIGDYEVLLSKLASYGYIIAAHESCNTGCSDLATDLYDPPGFKNMYKEQLKVIDWAKEQGAAGDAVLSNVNFDIGIGISGHSMGGQATMKASSSLGAGHGIKAAVMHHAYTHTYDAPVVPFLAFTGAADVIATPPQTQRFYNLKDANPIKGYVSKTSATHFEPNSVGATDLATYSAAWFKVFLDETPQSGGVDFHEMIFGEGGDSLCHGGDGAMTTCEVHDGSVPPSPSPAPTPPAPSPPAPSPSPGLTCDQCEAQGYKKDECACGVCGSFGLCTWTCSPGGERVACDNSVLV